MRTATATVDPGLRDAAAHYAEVARAAGCPADQLRNFARAKVILQPRQLAFAAAARLCDRRDGPTAIGFGGARAGGKVSAAWPS